MSEPMSERIDFAFSRRGDHGVCLRVGDGDAVLESWTLRPSGRSSCRPVAGVPVTQGTNALPLGGGRILLYQSDGTPTRAPGSLAVLRLPAGGGYSVTPLGEIPSLLGGYLLPSPNLAQLGFLVALDGPDRSTIWRLSASAPQAARIAEIPGSLSGGVWLDGDARVLAANQTTESCRSRDKRHNRQSGHSGIVVDLTDGSWRRFWSVSDTSTDRIWLHSPRSGLLVVSTDATGEERLGWGFLGDGRVRFPDELHRPGFWRRPLALDEAGERVLVHEVDGAVSRLFSYVPATRRLAPLAAPPGTISTTASWTGDLIRFGFSTPSQPATLATLRPAERPRCSSARDGDAAGASATAWALAETGDRLEAGSGSWADAELVELDGPAGPIETIVYGGPAWRRSPHLVLALHGGPLSSWRFEFDPLFQCLASAGVAVAAPNYRGSTGYGHEHLRPVLGDWGGADLADVLHLGRGLAEWRARLGPGGLPGPIVLGASYGAFLALLAACALPTSQSPQSPWSACVALAPFLSGPSLHRGAEPVVRDRIATLGGLRHRGEASDASAAAAGPRDVLDVCASLSVPLLLVHGTEDLTVPVRQSRMLARRLAELGRTEGVDFSYVEVGGDHRDIASARRDALRQRIVRFCLARTITESPIALGKEVKSHAARHL